MTDRLGQRETAGQPCAALLEKRTSWAVPRLFGITQRVPIAVVVVALTGENLGLVMLDFFSVRFCTGNDGEIARGLPVVYTSGITQRAGDAISFGFIGISEIARSLP